MRLQPRHLLIAVPVTVGLTAGAYGISAAANRQAEPPTTSPSTTSAPAAPDSGSKEGDKSAKKQKNEEAKQQEQAQLAGQAKVSEQQAKDAAVAATGGGTVKKAKLDEEDGVVVWEVEVTKPDNTEADVIIDANSAAVITQEADGGKDTESGDDAAEKQQEADEQANWVAQAKVNEQQAKDAAAQAAGGTATEAELDKKKGVLVWEVDVTKPDNSKAEVKIDASTGAVVGQKQENGQANDDD